MLHNIGGMDMASDKVTMQQIEKFAHEWITAGGEVVQDWAVWEQLAADVLLGPDAASFTMEGSNRIIMHQVMLIVVAVCMGSVNDVKRVARETTPTTLEFARHVLGHLHHFSAVLDAEFRYRLSELSSDWTIEPDGNGRLIVRTEFRARDTHH